MGELSRALELLGWPVAFRDMGVSRHPDGREFGEVGVALGMDQTAKHCKLVVRSPVVGTAQPQQRPQPATTRALEAASDSPFEGITVIRLDGEEAAHAIAGGYAGGQLHGSFRLVTFVSPHGTYASLTVDREACVAWSAAGVQADGWITFGIKHDAYEGKPQNPEWCQPFTLHWLGDGRVRLVAENEVPQFGRKGDRETRLMSHDGIHDIVARAPAMPPTFNLPVFDLHGIHGISLGPVTPQDGQPRVAIGQLKHSPLGRFKQFTAQFKKFPDQSYGGNVRGEVADMEATGWSSDVLVSSFVQEQLPSRSDAQAIANAFIERFGPPTVEGKNDRFNLAELFWLHDLDGRLLAPDDGAVDNCLDTIELWRANTHSLATLEDIGPWGCSLVTYLSLPGIDVGSLPGDLPQHVFVGSTNSFRLEMLAGHAMAMNRFATRLQELADARAALGVAADAGARGAVAVRGAETVMADATSAPGLASFDFLAPAGIGIGMALAQAEAALTTDGFRSIGSSQYKADYDRASILVDIRVDSSTLRQAPPKGAVRSIRYIQDSLDLTGPPETFVEGMTERLGTPPYCAILEPELADCTWEWPPNDPLVRSAHLTFKSRNVRANRAQGPGFELMVSLEAVSDLGTRLASGPNDDGPMDGRSTVGDIDPLEPEGVAIGMAVWQAASALKTRGYQRGLNCEFRLDPTTAASSSSGSYPGKPGSTVNRKNLFARSATQRTTSKWRTQSLTWSQGSTSGSGRSRNAIQ